jgi:hypothetical protein
MVIGWPTNAVAGDTELKEIWVLALFTVCVGDGDKAPLLELKFALPL